MGIKGQKAWNKGLTKETDARIKNYASALTGKKRSEEIKRKFSEIKKRLFKENKLIPPMLGKHRSEESKNKQSKTMIEGYETHRIKVSPGCFKKGHIPKCPIRKGQHISPLTEFKMEQSPHNLKPFSKRDEDFLKENYSTNTNRELATMLNLKISRLAEILKRLDLTRNYKGNELYLKKYGHPLKGKKNDLRKQLNYINNPMKRIEVRNKSSKKMKENWKDIEFQRRMWKSHNGKPNRPEKILINLFQNNNLPYRYTGDFRFWIEGRNPDFVNVNGQKKVIELFGDYWHDPIRNKKLDSAKTEPATFDHYRKYGFDCLIIWEKELKDIPAVLERVRSFDNA